MTRIIPRHITKLVSEDFKDIDAVFINGSRQVGKSTFVQTFAEYYKKVTYITFDDITVRAAEITSPGASFGNITEGLVILDEIQLVPNSFLALKLKIDEARRKKEKVKFLLTGSADVMLYPKLSEALVGRMYVRTMYPFSAAEILGTPGNFLIRMFKSAPEISGSFSKFSFSSVVSKATFPKLSLDVKNKAQWCQSYISTLLERDVKNLSDIDKIEVLPQLLSILAGRTGGLLNEADLASAVKVSQPTLKRYRTLLDGVFLTFLLPPWFKNLEKRFVKSPKIYFNDTMLLCHLLGCSPDEIKAKRPDIYGLVLENFAVVELKKQLALMDDGMLFHLRTSDLKEIDFVIEKRNGDILAIEVKAAQTVMPDDFKHIRFLQKALPEKFIRGTVLYSGEKIIEFGKNLYAVPITALWQM
ncbi:MAG: ATP-binding protein [Leptospirales bacterium]|nr:ATP-binding protein [Leptospirales bacterium]